MKALLTFLLLATFAFSTHASEIRVRNDSNVDFKDVVVGGETYGDIKQGATSGYQTWKLAYRYSSVSLVAGSKPLTIRPLDYVGEKPLGDGYFTFVLTIKDGRLDFRSEKDNEFLKLYHGEIVLPAELLQTYGNLVAAMETGKQEEIEKFCITGEIKVTTDSRPKDDRGYGQDINLPYIKDGFHKPVLSLRRDSDTEYLIRTVSTAFWFTRTEDGKWKLSKYLDKPIQ